MFHDPAKLHELALAVRNLPSKTAGRFADGNRVLELKDGKACRELRIIMSLTDDTLGNPLLNAKLSIPVEPEGQPVVENLRRHSGGSFLRREERYLQAMMAWALGVLSAPHGLKLSPVNQRPAWKTQLRAFISAAANDAGATARSYFRLRESALDAIDDEHKALDAAYFLRDSGKAIHVDWRDGDSLGPLGAAVARETEHDQAVDCFSAFKPTDDVDTDLAALRTQLSELGLALVQVDTGDDSYLFVLTTANQSATATKALHKLGVSAWF